MDTWEDTEDFEVDYILVKMFDDGGEESFTVGSGGVTKIEKTYKSGMYSNIPYLRVFKGSEIVAEMCQHNVTLVGFKNG